MVRHAGRPGTRSSIATEAMPMAAICTAADMPRRIHVRGIGSGARGNNARSTPWVPSAVAFCAVTAVATWSESLVSGITTCRLSYPGRIIVRILQLPLDSTTNRHWFRVLADPSVPGLKYLEGNRQPPVHHTGGQRDLQAPGARCWVQSVF